MKLLTVDFETYYDSKFSLKRLPLLLYVRSPQFKVHGAAVKWSDGPSEWITGERLADWFSAVPWTDTAVISHNSLFDLLVLHEHYGVSPAQRIDTLGLCRALLPRDLNFDLGAIAPILGVGEKGKELVKSRGVRDLDPETEEEIARYACNDADLAWGIYCRLWPMLPDIERRVMDLLLKISTEGVLRYDPVMGYKAIEEIEQERQQLLAEVGIDDPKQLTSRTKFAELLRARGVEPPTKISPRTGEETYAFSKQDPEFVRLRSDPRVGTLIRAREAWSSNNALTRARALLEISRVKPFTLPVCLNYNGAHTGRFSGGGGINLQNLNRGSKLRLAITAPPGYVILVSDSSQIELRINMWFSGQKDVLVLLKNGGDPYRQQASEQFNIPFDQVTTDQRAFGKVIELACGYGMGADKFRATCAIGPMGNPPIYISEEQAIRAIQTYRRSRPWVKASWDTLQNMVIPLMLAKDRSVQHGPVVVEHERIVLPSGRALLYPGLMCRDDEWIWGINGKTHRIYGGILQENIVQALAGEIIKWQMLEAQRAFDEASLDARVVHQVHDEILAVVREDQADKAQALLVDVMKASPDWAPDLPLDCEAGYAFRYSK